MVALLKYVLPKGRPCVETLRMWALEEGGRIDVNNSQLVKHSHSIPASHQTTKMGHERGWRGAPEPGMNQLMKL